MTHGFTSRANQGTWHFFRNDSGEQVPPFALLKVTGVVQASGKTSLTCDQPDGTFERLYAVNGPSAVDDGQVGQCTIDPSCVVRYESGTPALGESWGGKSGQWGLESGRPGFTIIGLTGTSSTLSLVEAIQQPVLMLTGKADAEITADSTADVSIHFVAASATASEYNVSAHLDWIHNSENISSGKQVLLRWMDGQWLVIGAECE